jgi:hypothetical protein
VIRVDALLVKRVKAGVYDLVADLCVPVHPLSVEFGAFPAVVDNGQNLFRSPSRDNLHQNAAAITLRLLAKPFEQGVFIDRQFAAAIENAERARFTLGQIEETRMEWKAVGPLSKRPARLEKGSKAELVRRKKLAAEGC